MLLEEGNGFLGLLYLKSWIFEGSKWQMLKDDDFAILKLNVWAHHF